MQISAKEEMLFWRWEKREKAALEGILSLYARSLYAFMCCLLGQHGPETRNVLIEGFVAILGQSGTSEKPFRVRFLRRMVSHSLSQARSAIVLSTIPLHGIQETLLAALGCLDAEDRLLILLRDQQDLLYEEMKEVLQWPEEKIRKRLNEARLRFWAQVEIIFNKKRKDGPK